jgi:hypothetical protein
MTLVVPKEHLTIARHFNAGLGRAEVTEWVCFSMNEPGELDAVRPYFRGVDRRADSPRGSFIVCNRESGDELCGKLF